MPKYRCKKCNHEWNEIFPHKCPKCGVDYCTLKCKECGEEWEGPPTISQQCPKCSSKSYDKVGIDNLEMMD